MEAEGGRSRRPRRTGGGLWSGSDDWPLCFVADLPEAYEDLLAGDGRLLHPNVLYAYTPQSEPALHVAIDALVPKGARVMLDSGGYVIAAEWSRQRGVTVREAFGQRPEDVDGYDDWLARYIEFVRRYEADLWGYVELDIGGPRGKAGAREAMRRAGLEPIPVWHPAVEEVEYLRDLLVSYDRVAVGNFVDASVKEKATIARVAVSEARRHGSPWLHFFGASPRAWTASYVPSSLDTTRPSKITRWAEMTMLAGFEDIGLQTRALAPPSGGGPLRTVACRFGYDDLAMLERALRSIAREQEEK